MKAQGRGDEIDERRGRLEFHAGEIAVTGQISESEMMADTVPMVGGLQRQFGIFRSFQFQNGETIVSGDREQVEDPEFNS
jgi:hypothetical protein